jgi:hypothetical protein
MHIIPSSAMSQVYAVYGLLAFAQAIPLGSNLQKSEYDALDLADTAIEAKTSGSEPMRHFTRRMSPKLTDRVSAPSAKPKLSVATSMGGGRLRAATIFKGPEDLPNKPLNKIEESYENLGNAYMSIIKSDLNTYVEPGEHNLPKVKFRAGQVSDPNFDFWITTQASDQRIFSIREHDSKWLQALGSPAGQELMDKMARNKIGIRKGRYRPSQVMFHHGEGQSSWRVEFELVSRPISETKTIKEIEKSYDNAGQNYLATLENFHRIHKDKIRTNLEPRSDVLVPIRDQDMHTWLSYQSEGLKKFEISETDANWAFVMGSPAGKSVVEHIYDNWLHYKLGQYRPSKVTFEFKNGAWPWKASFSIAHGKLPTELAGSKVVL